MGKVKLSDVFLHLAFHRRLSACSARDHFIPSADYAHSADAEPVHGNGRKKNESPLHGHTDYSRSRFSWEASRAVPIDECGERWWRKSYPGEDLVRPSILHMLGAIPECDAVRCSNAFLKLQICCPTDEFCSWTWRSAISGDAFQKFRSELRKKMPLLDDAEITVLASQFVAPPSLHPERPSPHITGGAVDLTIVDKMGFCLPMGTGFDETSEKSATVWYEKKIESKEALSEDEMEALYNRRLLYYVMHKAGFTNYPDEWWYLTLRQSELGVARGRNMRSAGNRTSRSAGVPLITEEQRNGRPENPYSAFRSLGRSAKSGSAKE